MLSRAEEVRRLRALRESTTIEEAAAKLGLSVPLLSAWSKSRGFPKKEVLGLEEHEEARRRRAYEVAESDSDAAESLGLRVQAFQSWRKSRSLPPKRRKGLSKEAMEYRLRVFRKSGSVKDAAHKLGLQPGAFHDWLAKRGHVPPRVRPRWRKPEELLRAYHETGSDAQAAKELGMPREQFAVWRCKRKLPNKGPGPGRRLDSKIEKKRLRAYQKAWSDQEAADLLGILQSTFTNWRISKGLPPPGSKIPSRHRRVVGPRQGAKSRFEEERRRRAYDEQGSDDGAAKALGIPIRRFISWRRNRRLAPRGPGSGNWADPQEHERRMRAYEETKNDSEAARRLNLPPGTFHNWRRSQSLPNKRSTKNSSPERPPTPAKAPD